jgi:hypothetical protein
MLTMMVWVMFVIQMTAASVVVVTQYVKQNAD